MTREAKRLAKTVRVELAKRMLSRNMVFIRMRMAGSKVGRTRFFSLLSGQSSDCLPFTKAEVKALARAIGCTQKGLLS